MLGVCQVKKERKVGNNCVPVVEGNSGKLLPAKGAAGLCLPHCTDEQTETLCSSPTASLAEANFESRII